MKKIETNYLLQIKAFYVWLEQNPISSAAIALWHGLMFMWNQSFWAEKFTPAMVSICLRTGLSVPTIRRARNELIDAGLLEINERGRSACEYKLVKFCEKNEPIYKQNKTKQNKTKQSKEKEKIFSVDVYENYQKLLGKE